MNAPTPNSDVSEVVYSLLQIFLQTVYNNVDIILQEQSNPTSKPAIEAKCSINALCQCFMQLAQKTQIILPDADRENLIIEIDTLIKKIPAEMPKDFRQGLAEMLGFLKEKNKRD